MALHQNERVGLVQGQATALLLVGLGLVCLLVFQAIGAEYFNHYRLDLGTIRFPKPRHITFLSFWSVLGGAAVWFMSLGIVKLIGKTPLFGRLETRWHQSSDALWITGGALLGAALPLVLRFFVLEGAPLTDDESVYRFQAQLLATGRLTGTSLPGELKLFLDRIFMINDGRMYGQYFVGWPALMVPGVWLGATGVMNALYSALTVPALFLVVRRLFGSGWSKVVVLLYLSAPFLMIGAATELSNTSCIAVLAWFVWFFLRTKDREPRWWDHAGLAVSFSIAFFIRPTSALGVGLPFLIAWLFSLRRYSRARRMKALIAFALPALGFAALFLSVNQIQNGSAFQVSYRQVFKYMEANDYRFAGRGPQQAHQHHSFDFTDVSKALANTGTALYRLNYALFGWPASLALLLVAGFRRRVRLFWASFACYLAVHFFLDDIGIDTFGPLHFVEIALPVLVLSIAGLRGLFKAGRKLDRQLEAPFSYRSLPVVGLGVVILVSLAGYVPVRLIALHDIATAVNQPTRIVERAGLREAVVFAPKPFAPSCSTAAPKHFVFWRPNNHPDLLDPVLWVNHISVEDDQRFMRYFPERTGYVLHWNKLCEAELMPLAELGPGDVPRGPIDEVKSTLDPWPDWSRVPAPETF